MLCFTISQQAVEEFENEFSDVPQSRNRVGRCPGRVIGLTIRRLEPPLEKQRTEYELTSRFDWVDIRQPQ